MHRELSLLDHFRGHVGDQRGRERVGIGFPRFVRRAKGCGARWDRHSWGGIGTVEEFAVHCSPFAVPGGLVSTASRRAGPGCEPFAHRGVVAGEVKRWGDRALLE